jgi:hypothetical protein
MNLIAKAGWPGTGVAQLWRHRERREDDINGLQVLLKWFQ